jgi:hypothetical protein
MEEVKLEDIRVGDYLKGVRKELVRDDDGWEITYFKVEKIDGESLISNFWIDSKDEILEVYHQKNGSEKYSDLYVYRLTEQEFYNICGKEIITQGLKL